MMYSLSIGRGLIEDGSFYLVQTRLPAGVFLRITIINPLTTADDLDQLLTTLRETGTDLLSKGWSTK